MRLLDFNQLSIIVRESGNKQHIENKIFELTESELELKKFQFINGRPSSFLIDAF